MRLPDMKYADKIVKTTQVKFGGLNRCIGAKDGELVDMANLTSDHSPVLATRPQRQLLRQLNNGGGLFAYERLCWVDGETFYYDDRECGSVTAGKKSFASIGRWIVIMPDKCCFNVDSGKIVSMEAKWSGNSLTFTNGLRFEEDAAANTIVCEGVNWEDYFSAGDAVSIRGCSKHTSNNISAVIRQIDGDKLYFSENIFVLDGDGTEGYTEEGLLRIERTMPDLIYICEHENRLWGCTEDTIYASKPGDPFNWFVYDGLDSDCWALTPASAGRFTGIVSFRGYVTCFKEDIIYKIYGSVPSNFEAIGSATMGVANGCSRSLAIADETLFYLSRSGIVAYTGGIPQPIGQAFGTGRFTLATGGSDGLKYYVSMRDDDYRYRMYVYDTQVGEWHIEDYDCVTAFARLEGTLYFLNDHDEILVARNDRKAPYDVVEQERPIAWMAEFSDFTEDDPNKKGVSKLQIRFVLEEDAYMDVDIQFDSDGVWHHVRRITGQGGKRSCYLPIIPRRCDHYRVRLSGEGGCQVYSMVRESYSGSETRSLPRR